MYLCQFIVININIIVVVAVFLPAWVFHSALFYLTSFIRLSLFHSLIHSYTLTNTIRTHFTSSFPFVCSDRTNIHAMYCVVEPVECICFFRAWRNPCALAHTWHRKHTLHFPLLRMGISLTRAPFILLNFFASIRCCCLFVSVFPCKKAFIVVVESNCPPSRHFRCLNARLGLFFNIHTNICKVCMKLAFGRYRS